MYMEEALRIVITKPKDISGQFFYVMDKTEAAKFTEVRYNSSYIFNSMISFNSLSTF